MPGYSVDLRSKNLSTQKNHSSATEFVMNEMVEVKTMGDTCDLIELIDKTTILANIKSIDSKTIIYNDCNSSSAKEHSIDKSQIAKITYKNGTVKNYHDDKCDIIKFQNKTTLTAKVVQIDGEQIKYKKCDDIDGQDYVVNKSDVENITYSNGRIEKFEQTKKVEEPRRRENGMNDSSFYKSKKIVVPKKGKYTQNGLALSQVQFWRIIEKNNNPTINKLIKESKKQTKLDRLGLLIIPLGIFMLNFPLVAIMTIPITWLGLFACMGICALAIIFLAIVSHRGKRKRLLVDGEAAKLYNEDLLK